PSITEAGVSDTQQNAAADINGTGRYVELTVYEADYWDKVSTQILKDGQIMFVNSMTSQKFVSKDGGSTWDTKSDDAFAAFKEKHYPISTAISKDGTLALICMDKKDESASDENAEYVYNLYIYNTDDTTKQISIDLPDTDSRLSELAFDEQGSLYAYASGCRVIYKIDVSEETTEKVTELQEQCYLMECKDNILMCMSSEKVFLYDMEKKNFIEDEALDSFTKENFQDMSWTGGGFSAYAFLGGDNTIYVAGDNGLHRHVIGGSIIEQVIDGSLSSFGAPSYDIMAVTVNNQSEFLAAYNNGKIVKFTYDATVSSVPSDKITVYSLNDDDAVRQAIAVYQTQYPNMYIEYQIGLDEGGITREDALKKLNTQLLGGNGPDVIMLDNMNIQAYSEKGVLMDLSDVVSEVDKNEGLYTNLIQNMQKDDKIYAIPATFCIPAIGGQKDVVDNINDYQLLADVVEQSRQDYPDTDILFLYSAKDIIKRFMMVCAPAWANDDKKLDTQKVAEFLEQSKRMYDTQMNGTPLEIITSHQKNGDDGGTVYSKYEKYKRGMKASNYLTSQSPIVHGEIIDAHAYREMLSLSKTKGFEDTVVKPLNGQSSNVYCPVSIAGVNAATKNPDAAKQFVSVMLSSSVLEVLEFGLPVNKKALAAKFAYDESKLDEEGGQYSESIVNKDGETYRYIIYPVNQDGIDNLEKWIAVLDTPYQGDTILENAVYTEGAAYIEGRQDIDAAVKAIADSVEIYLYE
ncbi:MAG: extracellular solute-binding protein, partial [Lachnospiraceae bacterium]|nr:extracellular solute-binding protein [Lachnospiraceae bacterium]